MVTRQTLHAFIARYGLENSILCMHSSLKSFGPTEQGPYTIIDGLLDMGCTLVCPAFFYASSTFPNSGSYDNNGIDYSSMSELPQQSYEDAADQVDRSMGIIPRTMVRYERAHRTKNPSNSFVAIGEKAESLLKNQSLLNAYSVYKNIYAGRDRAHVLLAGVGFTSCTPIHFAEEVAGRTLFRRWAVYRGETVEVEVGSCSAGFEKISQYTKGLETTGTLGKSAIRMYPFSAFIDTVARAIKEHPAITSCDDAACVRCRDMASGGRRPR